MVIYGKSGESITRFGIGETDGTDLERMDSSYPEEYMDLNIFTQQEYVMDFYEETQKYIAYKLEFLVEVDPLYDIQRYMEDCGFNWDLTDLDYYQFYIVRLKDNGDSFVLLPYYIVGHYITDDRIDDFRADYKFLNLEVEMNCVEKFLLNEFESEE